MIRKLPSWVEFGAFSLALNAGIINTVALLGFTHQAVSHVTGSVSALGAEAISGNFSNVLHLLLVAISFLLGATLSGLITQDATLKLGRRYGVALLVESLLLVVALAFLLHRSELGHLFASAACGLQNALVTTFSGAVVRTTHLTGVVTDLGISLGQWLRGNQVDNRKIRLYLLIFFGFLCGSVLGAQGYQQIQLYTLGIAAGITLFLALLYSRYLQAQRVSNQKSK